ncbi:pyridoxal phosphate-dependent aminotransferase [Rhodocista pekingensis]|uniref:Aminotransferase n=1 Tax=Rhodocista pekingensis TaxID=201185 RepID=A0ABW2KQT4_9PROT
MPILHDLPGLRPVVAGLEETRIVQMVQYGRGREGLIPLWVGEGDVPTPDFIREACDRAIREGRVFYTWQRGLPELREGLAAYLSGNHGAAVGMERITVASSGMQAIMLALQALVGPGDEVVVVTPVWPNVMSAVALLGGVVVPVPLEPGPHGWRLDPDRVAAAIGPRTKALFVNSPSNPTGWVLDRDGLCDLWALARRTGIWLIADEVYGRLVYDRAPGQRAVAPSFLELAGPEDRLIVLNSFSKNWAMTGWRLGWLVTPPELGRVLEKLVQINTSGTPEFIQMAGLAALERGEDFLAATLERCRTGRGIVMAALAPLAGVRLLPPAGAFYAFLAVPGVTDTLAFAKDLLDRCGVGLAPGCAFGPGGEGHLRLCFASSAERLHAAMARLVPALEALAPGTGDSA